MVNSPNETVHHPVLVTEVVEMLATNPDGAYLDLTAGGGGHLKALALKLSEGARLYGLDRDAEAVARVSRATKGIVQFKKIEKAAFGDLTKVAPLFGETGFDGILLDLGLSSYQLDSTERGFSFRSDGLLDMRFDQTFGKPVYELIGSSDEKQLMRIIREYGEEKLSARIARKIVMERTNTDIRTARQLTDIILSVVYPPGQNKSLARVFQAFRIAVNDEMKQLADVLPASLELLNSGGRLAVISYHSLEDRQVKRFLQAEAKGRCTCPATFPVCACGASSKMKIITRRPVAPEQTEIDKNPRARSARLRVGEKL